MKENKAMDKKYEKCQFCTQRRSKNRSSRKISEKYNDQEIIYKKTVLNNFAIHGDATVLEPLF